MIKERLTIAVISAVCGAGLMLLALGTKPSDGIAGWTSMNEAVAAAAQPAQAAEDNSGKDKTGVVTDRSSSQLNSTSVVGVTAPGPSSPPSTGVEAGTGSASAGGSGGAAASVPQAHQDASSAAPAVSGSSEASSSGVISINTAGLTELQELPGIGEKKAQAIIEYRTQHGPFSSLDDLKNVKGIGDKMFEKMRPYIGL